MQFSYQLWPRKELPHLYPQSWISVLSLNIFIEWWDFTKKIFISQWNISIQMLSSSSSKRDWDSCSSTAHFPLGIFCWKSSGFWIKEENVVWASLATCSWDYHFLRAEGQGRLSRAKTRPHNLNEDDSYLRRCVRTWNRMVQKKEKQSLLVDDPPPPKKKLHLIKICSIFFIRMVYFECLQVNPHIQAVQNMCGKGG